MGLTLKCYATLAKYAPPGTGDLELRPGETVAGLLQRLGIPAAEVTIIMRNGRSAKLDEPLAHGDRLGLFPAVGGG
jgi:sulfur-carrier protein